MSHLIWISVRSLSECRVPGAMARMLRVEGEPPEAGEGLGGNLAEGQVKPVLGWRKTLLRDAARGLAGGRQALGKNPPGAKAPQATVPARLPGA